MLLPILFLILLLTAPPTSAQNASLSPTPTAANPLNLEEIQKIRQAVQQKVQEKLKEINNPSETKKAIVGTVSQISDNQITITYQNQESLLQLSDDSVIIDSKRNKSKISLIKTGQDILAMGYQTEAFFDTKRLVFINLKELENKYQTIAGKIVDISQSSSVFVLIPGQNKNQQYQVSTNNKTQIVNTENISLKYEFLKNGNRTVVIVKSDPKNTKTLIASKIIALEYSPPASPTPKTPSPTPAN